jgi:hypothetical protein
MRVITLFPLLLLSLAGIAAELPITDVVLFTSGVGYVQRSGTVTDTATVELTFMTEQINDLLKSLVVLDLNGGTAGSVSYAAKDPVHKTLQAFALDLSDNLSLAQLLTRLRGVRVEVVTTKSIIGKVLGVETRTRKVGDDVFEETYLVLLTDDGIKAVALAEITNLRLLDPKLNQELQEAMKVLASGLDSGRKPVQITFAGKGTRKVLVGYLTEMPLWKTSYRLVLGEKENLLQGWAIVENTSDADWTKVKLSLVSGRPISFIQDLYTPLYVPRPVVVPELYASLRPQRYGATLEEAEAEPEPAEGEGKAEDMDGTRTRVLPSMPPPPRPQTSTPPTPHTGWSAGDLRQSVVTAAVATNLGQAFAYDIKDPVTLPRQQSALLPILAGAVQALPVSIYTPDNQTQHPLYGVQMTNTTGLHLMGGPLTVYRDGVYAGDATIEDVQPGEKRLLAYAIDLGVQAERQSPQNLETILAMKLVHGALTVTRKYRRTTHYTFRVADARDRTLVVEHAFLSGWELVEPKLFDERTDALYRFIRKVPGGGTLKLGVVEERTAIQEYRVVGLDSSVLVDYLQTGNTSKAVQQALQRVIALQAEVRELTRQRTVAEAEIRAISEEQGRLRANMSALDRNSDLYKRYVTKLDDGETRIERLRALITDLYGKIEAKRKELEDYVNGLDLE